MPRLSIAFEWKKDARGFRLELNQRDRPARIVRNGGALVAYDPLKIPALYVRFAAVTNPDALLKFVNTYGPLSKAGLLKAPSAEPKVKVTFGKEIRITELEAGENVREALVHAAWFRRVLKLKDSPNKQKLYIGSPKPLKLSEGRLVSDRHGFRIEYRPRTLLEAMRVQLALMLIDGKGLAYCPHCHQPFEVRRSRKRADAKYCSKEHRIRYNSLKRTKR